MTAYSRLGRRRRVVVSMTVLVSFYVGPASTLAARICQLGVCGPDIRHGSSSRVNRPPNQPVPRQPSQEELDLAARKQRASEAYQKGLDALDGRLWKDAISWFTTALDLAPDDIEIREHLDSAKQRLANQEATSQIIGLRHQLQNATTLEAIKALQRDLEAPCNPSASLQSGSDVVNPAMFVTQAQCESAFSEMARLQRQRDNLTTKIAELQQWGTGLAGDEKEFENIRLEAQHDAGWEFVDHVPVADGLDALEGSPALKGLNMEILKAGYDAAKGFLQTGRGIFADDDHTKADEILSGNRALRDALIDAAGLDEKSKTLLDAVSKIINYSAEIAVADDTTTRDRLKTVMTLVEILEPWWGLGVAIEDGSERGVQYLSARAALNSLHEAQSSNWNAQAFLKQKVGQLNDKLAEEQLIVTKYQMASD
jgi:hypothetical protein